MQNQKYPTVAAYNSPDFVSTQTRSPRENNPLRNKIAQIVAQQVRQELRRTNSNQQGRGPPNRNRRTFDGRPICNVCIRVGHVGNAKYKKNP